MSCLIYSFHAFSCIFLLQKLVGYLWLSGRKAMSGSWIISITLLLPMKILNKTRYNFPVYDKWQTQWAWVFRSAHESLYIYWWWPKILHFLCFNMSMYTKLWSPLMVQKPKVVSIYIYNPRWFNYRVSHPLVFQGINKYWRLDPNAMHCLPVKTLRLSRCFYVLFSLLCSSKHLWVKAKVWLSVA